MKSYLNLLVLGMNLDSVLDDLGMLIVSDVLKTAPLEAISLGVSLNAILGCFKNSCAKSFLNAILGCFKKPMCQAPVASRWPLLQRRVTMKNDPQAGATRARSKKRCPARIMLG